MSFPKILHKIASLVPDNIYIPLKFWYYQGYKPNLRNPKTLNEKIIWLKLYDRTPLHTQCADKYAVRSYVIKKIGDQYLAPLFYHTTNPKEIIPENLPDKPCVIKTNHDSGGVYFVRDKRDIDWKSLQNSLKNQLKTDYYSRSKEWQYKNIQPRIIVEKLLLDEKGKIPFDYKLHCFNGKVNMIQVDVGRGTGNHFRNWYTSNWKRTPFKWTTPLGKGKFTEPSKVVVKRPKVLQEMIKLSEILSSPFSYVRIDWYIVEDMIYFGEITFHHDSGLRPIEPKKWDLKLGEELELRKTIFP